MKVIMNPVEGHVVTETHENERQRSAGIGQVIARSLAIGLGYAVVTLVMGVLLRLGTGDGFVAAFLLLTLGGMLLALVVSPTAQYAHLSRAALIAVLWLVLFLVSYFINAIEVPFFTTLPLGQLAAEGLQVLVATFVVAWLFDRLFPQELPTVPLGLRLRDLLSQRSWRAWLRRFVLCSLAYIGLYLVVGAIFYMAFTQPYYTDPALAARLHLKPPPGFGVILPLEFIRGLLFALALLPLIAVARLGRGRLAIWLGLILFVAGGLVPLLINQAWPVALRVYHGVEIFFQNLPLGLVIGYLLNYD